MKWIKDKENLRDIYSKIYPMKNDLLEELEESICFSIRPKEEIEYNIYSDI